MEPDNGLEHEVNKNKTKILGTKGRKEENYFHWNTIELKQQELHDLKYQLDSFEMILFIVCQL